MPGALGPIGTGRPAPSQFWCAYVGRRGAQRPAHTFFESVYLASHVLRGWALHQRLVGAERAQLEQRLDLLLLDGTREQVAQLSLSVLCAEWFADARAPVRDKAAAALRDRWPPHMQGRALRGVSQTFRALYFTPLPAGARSAGSPARSPASAAS